MSIVIPFFVGLSVCVAYLMVAALVIYVGDEIVGGAEDVLGLIFGLPVFWIVGSAIIIAIHRLGVAVISLAG